MELTDPLPVCDPCGIRCGIKPRDIGGILVRCAVCGELRKGTDGVTWADYLLGLGKTAHRPIPGYRRPE